MISFFCQVAPFGLIEAPRRYSMYKTNFEIRLITILLLLLAVRRQTRVEILVSLPVTSVSRFYASCEFIVFFSPPTELIMGGHRAAAKVSPNKDGSVTFSYQPNEPGIHEMQAVYNEKPVDGECQNISPGRCKSLFFLNDIKKGTILKGLSIRNALNLGLYFKHLWILKSMLKISSYE